MASLAKAVLGLSALAFVLAVLVNFGEVPGITLATSEGYSRASANLALLAIAVLLSGRDSRTA